MIPRLIKELGSQLCTKIDIKIGEAIPQQLGAILSVVLGSESSGSLIVVRT